MTQQMTGAEMVIKALIDQGVEYVFGYPGGAVLPIYDAMFQQDKLKHILVRDEVVRPALGPINQDNLRRAARFWFGSQIANKMRKAEIEGALLAIFNDPVRLRAGLQTLAANEKEFDLSSPPSRGTPGCVRRCGESFRLEL